MLNIVKKVFTFFLALFLLSLFHHIFLHVCDDIAEVFSFLESLMTNYDLPCGLLLEALMFLFLLDAILFFVNICDGRHLRVLASDDRGHFLVVFHGNVNGCDACYIAALPEVGAGVSISKVDGKPDIVMWLVCPRLKLFFLLPLELLLPRLSFHCRI